MLDKLLSFAKLLNELQAVERVVRVRESERWENDAEHSYQLAMLAWYTVIQDKLPLDAERVLKLALAHDIVEVYAGDTYIYSTDQAHLDSKPERERTALERLQTEFPEAKEILAAAAEYAARTTPESRFVYALDKILPVISIYLDGGRTWHEKGVTLAMLEAHKRDKVALAPELVPYYEELITLLRSEEEKLFPHSGGDRAV
jgi:putative hydrolases of HD superfamily